MRWIGTLVAAGAKYDKAAACLAKDRAALLAFYDFPAEHWKHVRSSNSIESTFATVRLRTDKIKGCRARATALAMRFKLAKSAERHWRGPNGSERLADILRGVPSRNGEVVTAAENPGRCPKIDHSSAVTPPWFAVLTLLYKAAGD